MPPPHQHSGMRRGSGPAGGRPKSSQAATRLMAPLSVKGAESGDCSDLFSQSQIPRI
jgi:hypothetical protein